MTKATGGGEVTKPTLRINCSICKKPVDNGTGLIKNGIVYHRDCFKDKTLVEENN